MKISKLAATALVPAAVAGITMSSWAAVQTATGHQSARAAVRQVREIHRVHPVRPAGQHAARHTAHGSTRTQVSGARQASSGRVLARHGAHAKTDHRAHARAASPAARSAAASFPSSLLSGMSAFEQCVAWRESGDNPAASSAGLFGILPPTWASLGYPGTAGQASVAMQKAAFSRLYAQYGTSPWAPYDGC